MEGLWIYLMCSLKIGTSSFFRWWTDARVAWELSIELGIVERCEIVSLGVWAVHQVSSSSSMTSCSVSALTRRRYQFRT